MLHIYEITVYIDDIEESDTYFRSVQNSYIDSLGSTNAWFNEEFKQLSFV